MPRKYYAKYTRELLTEAAENSISIADVLRYLQIPWSGAPMPISAAGSSSRAKTRRISWVRLTGGISLPRGDSPRNKFW